MATKIVWATDPSNPGNKAQYRDIMAKLGLASTSTGTIPQSTTTGVSQDSGSGDIPIAEVTISPLDRGIVEIDMSISTPMRRARDVGSFWTEPNAWNIQEEIGKITYVPLSFTFVDEDHGTKALETIFAAVIARYLRTSADVFVWTRSNLGFPLLTLTPYHRSFEGLLQPIYVRERMRAYLLGKANVKRARGFRALSIAPIAAYALERYNADNTGLDPEADAMPTRMLGDILVGADDPLYDRAAERIRAYISGLAAEGVFIGRGTIYTDLIEMWGGEILRPGVVLGKAPYTGVWYRQAADDVRLGYLPLLSPRVPWQHHFSQSEPTTLAAVYYIGICAYLYLAQERPYLFPYIADISVTPDLRIHARFARRDDVMRYETILSEYNTGDLPGYTTVVVSSLEMGLAYRWYVQQRYPTLTSLVLPGNVFVVDGNITTPGEEELARARADLKERMDPYYPEGWPSPLVLIDGRTAYPASEGYLSPIEKVRGHPLRVTGTEAWLTDTQAFQLFFHELGLRGYFNRGPLLGVLAEIPVLQPSSPLPGDVTYEGESVVVSIPGRERPIRLFSHGFEGALEDVRVLWRAGWFLSPWSFAHLAEVGTLPRAGYLRLLGDWHSDVSALAHEIQGKK